MMTHEEIEKILNEDLEIICDRFVDNKLSIHFGDDKIKIDSFASNQRAKSIRKLSIRCKETTSTNNMCWMCIRRVNVW